MPRRPFPGSLDPLFSFATGPLSRAHSSNPCHVCMESLSLMNPAEHTLTNTAAGPPSPPRANAPFFVANSAGPSPTRLNISESSKAEGLTPPRSLRNSLFTHAEARATHFRAATSPPASEPQMHKPSLKPSELDTKLVREAPTGNSRSLIQHGEPQMRQSKIMTKSEKLRLKGSATDLESVEDAEMTIGVAPSTGFRFMLPDKKRSKSEEKEEPPMVLFGGRASITMEPTLKKSDKMETDDIDDNFLGLEPETANDSVHFEDDHQGLIARHKQSVANHRSKILAKSKEEDEDSELDLPEDLILSEDGKLPIVRVPAIASAKLFDYQREGIQFLYNLFVLNRGGILADDMGLGKTVQTICFVLAIKSGQASAASFFQQGPSSALSSDLHSPDTHSKLFGAIAPNPILIIAPASLLQHWHREFYQWTKLRTFIAHGKQERLQVLESAKSNKLDVVLMSYDTLVTCIRSLNVITFSCVIFDEAHKVKSRTSKQYGACAALKTKRKFGLTGTVMQNSFEELWALCHVLGFAATALGDLDYFKKHYIAPIKEGHVQDASSAQISRAAIVASSLVDKLSKFILRRTKQCIANQLPPKEDHIVFCAPTALQLKIYKRITDSPLYRLLRQNSTPCKCGSGQAAIRCCSRRSKLFDMGPSIDFPKVALPALTRLQQLANHVSLIVSPEMIQELQAQAALKRMTPSTNESKSFGVDSSTRTHLITNFFSESTEKKSEKKAESNSTEAKAKKSSIKSLRPSFASMPASAPDSSASSAPPGSNAPSSSSSSSLSGYTGNKADRSLSSFIDSAFLKMAFGEDIDEIAEALANGDDDLELCGKLKVLSSLLPHWKEQGAKVLLFSSSTRLMDVLARFCTKQGFSYGRVEGTTPIQQRQRLVDHFNKTKSQFVFIVSTKACGVGLNLSSANVVVIFEPHFNVSLDMQASDRAHRIGQVRTTRVYRLVSAFTIEELTYRRQIYKQQMANIATEGRSEKRFFKMTEVFGAHLLFSLLDRSQLNTVDILGRENTLSAQKDEIPVDDSKFRVTRDGVAQALAETSKDSNALLQLFMNKAQATDGLGLDEEGAGLGTTEEAGDESHATAGDGEHPNALDRSDFGDIDDILKKAGALHSHLNSELFGPAAAANSVTHAANASSAAYDEESASPSSFMGEKPSSKTPNAPQRQSRSGPNPAATTLLEPLPSAQIGSIRPNALSEDMEHLSPAFLGDGGAKKTSTEDDDFPELL